jgi:hypothetical protein
MKAWSGRKQRSINMLKLGSMLFLVGLLLSACGSDAFPTNISIPTGLPAIDLPTVNPPSIETSAATSPPATPASGETSTPGVSIPVTGGGSNGTTMLLLGLLALFAVIILFGFYIALGRPDQSPQGPDDTSEN